MLYNASTLVNKTKNNLPSNMIHTQLDGQIHVHIYIYNTIEYIYNTYNTIQYNTIQIQYNANTIQYNNVHPSPPFVEGPGGGLPAV